MKRLERLVAHVEEAIRLGTADDEAHLRLGLMLIDSAAELLMYRESNYLLHLNAMLYDSSLRMAEQQLAATGEGQDWVDELRTKVISKTRRRRIDREFDSKCDFLVEQGTLPEPHARALKKLHIYRNEIYHRDELRPATLANATRIYIYLVCTLMETLPVYSMGFAPNDPPLLIAKYLEPGESAFAACMELQGRVGHRLFIVAGLDKPLYLGEALSEHVTYRLDELEGAAEECALSFNVNNGDWDLESVLGMLQAPKPNDPMDHLRRTTADYRRWANPVNSAKIAEWRRAGKALAGVADDLTAFTAFADIEDAFEPIEAQVIMLVNHMDWEIECQIDMALGK